MKYSFYPGCSLEESGKAYKISLEKVFEKLGVEINELKDWTCCGASSGHSVNEELSDLLPALTVNQAAKEKNDLLVACSACFHRLMDAQYAMKNKGELARKFVENFGTAYNGDVKIRNILDVLVNDVKIDKVWEMAIKPRKDLTVACYYGCLITRIPRIKTFDDVENPRSMENVMDACGAKVVDWSYKTDCCGASCVIFNKESAKKLCAKIINSANESGANCIVSACPLCQFNLDSLQEDMLAEQMIPKTLPVYFITEVIGLAMGIKEEEMGLNSHFVI